MDAVSLVIENRKATGKEAARRLRREEKVPAVLYGKNTASILLKVSPDDLRKALDTPYRRNTVLDLKLGEKSYLTLIKDIQFEPVSRKIIHVDFYTVEENQEIKFKVPLKLTGKAVGVQLGGELFQLRRTLDIMCRLDDLPREIALDITELQVGGKKMVSDLDSIDGVKFLPKDNIVLAQVKSTRVIEEEVEVAVEGAEAGEEAGEKAEVETKAGEGEAVAASSKKGKKKKGGSSA